MCIIFACLVPVVVCLVSGFRYNTLARLALAAFSCVWALRAHCGPFGHALAQGIVKLRQYQLPTRVNGWLLLDLV